MEAIALFFTKFSDELLGAQAALLCFSLSLAIYWMLVRKKKRETAEWVPAALVKAYLDRMRADEQATRRALFGEESVPYASQPMTVTSHLTQAVGGAIDTKELDALRAQLSMADQRAMEFDRMLNALRAEKSALEQKLASAASAPAGGGAAPAELEAVKKAYAEAQAKLDEYGLIEDELASLKKFQKENEQLKARVSQLEAGGAGLTVVPGGAPAATPTTTIPNATDKITTPTMTVISGGAAPAAAPAAASAPAAPAATPAAPVAETNTNVLAPVTPQVDVGAAAPAAAAAPAPAPAAGGEKNPKQKEDELLSEFEKMLAS